MKKLFLMALLSASVVGMMQSCGSDTPAGGGTAALTVTETQRSLLIYNTATWCGPCGAYGSPEYKGALSTRDVNSLVCIDLHSSGSSYLVPTFVKNDTLFIANFVQALYAQTKPNGYIPHFYMSNSFLGNTGTTAATMTAFADDYNKTKPEIGVGANASLSGNKITVNYKMQAFNPEAGAKYYTSVVIVEKEVGCYQAGASGTFATHKNIVRASAHKSSNGNQIAFSETAIMDNPAKGAIVEKTATFDYVATPDKLVTQINTATQSASGFDFGWWKLNKSNTGVAVIVWKIISPTEMFYVNTVWADVK